MVTPQQLEQLLRSKLPPEKKHADWGYLAEQFPYFPAVHWARAAGHPADKDLLQKAALYSSDLIRLQCWLHSHAATNNAAPEPAAAATDAAQVPDEAAAPEPQSTNTGHEQLSMPEPAPETALHLPDNIPAETKDAAGATTDEPVAEVTDNPFPGLQLLKDANADVQEKWLFEPFHTKDYFASQGIKAEQQAAETPLDRQVKSFTDWLKTMKKLQYQPATTYTDPLVDRQAKKSLTEREINTEAMAEVWAKQGDKDRAAAIFTKLMLLHPEKSHYFAARLKDLNIHS